MLSGMGLEEDLRATPEWAAIEKQIRAENGGVNILSGVSGMHLNLAIDQAFETFKSAFSGLSGQPGVGPDEATQGAAQFTVNAHTIAGAVDSISNLVSAAAHGAPPAQLLQGFSSLVISVAVGAGAVTAGAGAAIAIGVAIVASLISNLLNSGGPPGASICGVTWTPAPQWVVSTYFGGDRHECFGIYGVLPTDNSSISPASPDWLRFPDPNSDAAWSPDGKNPKTGRDWYQLANGLAPIDLAFPQFYRMRCDLARPWPPALADFYKGFVAAWKANAEYTLNGLKAQPDWKVLATYVRIWNAAHDDSSTFDFGARDNNIGSNEAMVDNGHCLNTVPYVAILVSDIVRSQPGLAPNRTIRINTGARKNVPVYVAAMLAKTKSRFARSTALQVPASSSGGSAGSTAVKVVVGTAVAGAIGLGIWSFVAKKSYAWALGQAWAKVTQPFKGRSQRSQKRGRR